MCLEHNNCSDVVARAVLLIANDCRYSFSSCRSISCSAAHSFKITKIALYYFIVNGYIYGYVCIATSFTFLNENCFIFIWIKSVMLSYDWTPDSIVSVHVSCTCVSLAASSTFTVIVSSFCMVKLYMIKGLVEVL